MGSKGSQTTTSNTTSSANPEAMSAYSNLLDRAGSVASTPYQAYGGEGVAGVNAQQNTGIGGINNYANSAQPGIGQAMAQTQASSAPLSQAAIQQYMSPYTQNVVDATQAQFNDANAQQQQQVTGNAIAQGALGGNRTGVAAAETAKAQNLAQNPVIAGLYNSGYGQAVNTAVGQQGIGLQGAAQMGNLGVAGQTAGLQGAGAQIGAGTLQQQTQQALDAYNQGQFQQQQAFPYQQAQWLAGIDTGVGSQMGGTTSGATTGPAPNQTAQWLGTAASAAGAAGSIFSDARIKENIHSIGKLHNGQTIYRFNYKGNPQVHIGLIAQDVERTDKAHAVHEVNGVKAVDYDAASRAHGGAVQGYAGGGVAPPGMPYGGGNTYIPTNSIVHGSGPPHASAPAAPSQQQQDPSKLGTQIGDMTKSIMGSVNGAPGVDNSGQINGAVGPTSVNGAPLVGQTVPDSFGSTSVNGAPLVPMYGRGGGVAGFADGGAPDDTTVINPDEPYRLDPTADDAWRKGVDVDHGAGQTAQVLPENTNSKDLPVSQGVAPAAPAMAFTNDPKPDVPSEVALGYSKGHAPSQGVAISPQPTQSISSDSGDYWDGVKGRLKEATAPGSKLWPALMSAGFGMMASRSPFLGVAVGEGGQAGMATYGHEQEREAEAQKVAQQLEHQAREEARLNRAQQMQEEQHKQQAINQPIIFGAKGKPIVNPDYIKAKEAVEKSFKPTWGKIDETEGGREVMGWIDPNTKQVFDAQGKPYIPRNPAYTPPPPPPPGTAPTTGPQSSAAPATPGTTPVPTPPGSPQPSSPANASASADNPYKVASLNWVPPAVQQPSNAVPYEPTKPVPPASMDNPNTPTPPQALPPEPPPHPSDSRAPEGSDASRDTAMLARIAAEDPGVALAIKKAANYELDPGKYASMIKGHREKFINMVLRYDPNYRPQDVGLRYKAEAAFLPGTKSGDTVRSFNTAVSHLDTLEQLYKVVNNGDWQTYNKMKNAFQTEFGYAPPNTLNGIAQIVGGEVVKATVGSQNALGDREELRKTLDPKLAQGQALDVIHNFQALMGGQLHSLKFAYEQGTGLHNFEEKYLLPRSRDVLKHVDQPGSGAATVSPADKQALDWANANPKDPRAAAIKKKLGQ